MKKIYCSNCKYCSASGWFCNKKVELVLQDNYYKKEIVKKRPYCDKKNANNDCKDFDPPLYAKLLRHLRVFYLGEES